MQDPTPTERPRSRAIYLLPNLFTTGCLFSGFYAIVAAIDGNISRDYEHAYERAGFAVFAAMLFDTLDGRVARMTRTESAFGQEYDSLADMVSFGIAPAVLAYLWGVQRMREYGDVWGKVGWLAAFIYAVCAALRLARFNMRHGTADKRFFEGLPSPSAAAVVSAFIWFCSEWREPGLPGLIIAAFITASAGALMVSKFAYNSFKQLNTEGPVRFATFLLVPLGFILIALYPPIALLAIFGTYALSGPLFWLLRHRRKQQRAAETGGEAGDNPS
jgi:CDP-diacylglycerol--serine O-phosphatidyltransferase